MALACRNEALESVAHELCRVRTVRVARYSARYVHPGVTAGIDH